MYCCNCGKKLGEEDRFCDNCGTPVNKEETETVKNQGGRQEMPAADRESEAPKPKAGESGEAKPEAGESGETEPEAGEPGEAKTEGTDPEAPETEPENPEFMGTEPEEEPSEASGEDEEKTVFLGHGLQSSGNSAAFTDLEKKIMKNMEDELILEMPEAAGQPPYGSSQTRYVHSPYQGEQPGPQGQPFYGNGQHFVQGGQETGPYGPLPGELEPGKKPPKKKKKKVLIITLSCVVAVLAVTVAILLFLLLSPENKLKKCIEDRDWSAAATLYEEHFRGDEKREEKAGEILREAVDALREEFVAGTMDYSTVKRHLKGMEGFWDDDYVKDALEFVRELSDSRDAFEEAEQCMEREEYEDAIRLYGEVAESDPDYGIAQEKLETAKTGYKEKLLEEAQAYAKLKDYDSAIELVERGLEILDGDTELGSRLDELRGEREQYGIESVLAEAAGYASQNNYYEALEVIREGLLENAGNDKLEAALKDYSERYEQDILAKAEAAVGTEENYEAAILVIDSALNTLDGDYAQVEQAIREKREEYVQLQLDKSQRENAESALVGVWQGTMVSSAGLDIPMDQFLQISGMPGAAVTLSCQPSGSFHIDMFGEAGDGTWRRDEGGNGVYYLDIEGDTQMLQVDTSGRLHMDFDGVVVIFEKTGEA